MSNSAHDFGKKEHKVGKQLLIGIGILLAIYLIYFLFVQIIPDKRQSDLSREKANPEGFSMELKQAELYSPEEDKLFLSESECLEVKSDLSKCTFEQVPSSEEEAFWEAVHQKETRGYELQTFQEDSDRHLSLFIYDAEGLVNFSSYEYYGPLSIRQRTILNHPYRLSSADWSYLRNVLGSRFEE